jgi:hypothetical protein
MRWRRASNVRATRATRARRRTHIGCGQVRAASEHFHRRDAQWAAPARADRVGHEAARRRRHDLRRSAALQQACNGRMLSCNGDCLGCNGRSLSALDLSTPSMAGYHYDLNFLTIHGKSNFPGLNIWYCHYHHASQPSPALSCIHLRSRQGVGPEGRSGSARPRRAPAMGLLRLEELVQAGTPGGAGTGRAPRGLWYTSHVAWCAPGCMFVCQAARWVPSCGARARGMSPRAGQDVQHRATRATSHNVAQQCDVAKCHDARSIARRRETAVVRHCAATRYCAPLPEVAVHAPCSTALQRGAPCRSRACFVPAGCAMLQRPLVQAGAQIEFMTAGHVRAGYHEVFVRL